MPAIHIGEDVAITQSQKEDSALQHVGITCVALTKISLHHRGHRPQAQV